MIMDELRLEADPCDAWCAGAVGRGLGEPVSWGAAWKGKICGVLKGRQAHMNGLWHALCNTGV